MALDPVEQRLCRQIEARRADLLEDLRRHVALPTGHNNTEAIEQTRSLLVGRLEALGARSRRVTGDPKPPWLYGAGSSGPIPDASVCEAAGPRDGPRILIAGHMDTVHDPAGGFDKLSVEPDGLRATGPGCVDMKGGLVIAMCALEALEEAGVRAAWTFFLNADEETGTYHSDAALRAAAAAHDVGLALEPALAGGELAIERMGSGQFMIEARGRAAHVGRSFTEGVSAVNALAERLLRIAELADPPSGRIVSVGPLEGGSATNAVPARARAWGNARVPAPAVSEEIQAALAALATSHTECQGNSAAVRVERSFNRPAKPRTPQVERLALAAQAAAEDLGQSLPFASTGGVCDGNIMQDAGLPTIDTLGVRGGGLHTPDEWIELPSLVERCQLLAVLIKRLAGGTGLRPRSGP
ncbi:MAG: M20/M25/M40 family metallo-hydrolase [Phycisphaerales bacterium JB039]